MTLSLHLVSDLDGTWLPAEGKEGELHELETFLADHPDVTLTFATGRSFASALLVLSTQVRFWPDHLVTDVGTALFHQNGEGSWIEDAAYANWVASRWDCHPLFKRSDAWLPPGVQWQAEIDAPRRLALHVEPWREVEQAADELRIYLEKIGMVADVLGTGRCLDVLPKGVHKGTAALFLHSRLNDEKPLVACGDSENDLGLFQVADLAVLMADSKLELEALGLSEGHARRTSLPGPAGILATLCQLGQELEVSP